VAGLTPQPPAVLLARLLTEIERGRGIFGLPKRSFWQPNPGLDLSVAAGGGRAATPLGPAAGPHTQLAPNLVVAWLAGARVLELKTVQVNDRLEIPRPCIDAADLGYNVEWSQELTLAESAAEYLTAWVLVHVLGARGVGGGDTVFDGSVGYDLAGLRSDGVARFLDTLTDSHAALAAWRAALPRALAAAADVPVPERVIHAVTLSTFHGCPPEEIERMVEHLFERHALDVVVKFNPTLLGFEAVDGLLHDRLGYAEVSLERGAFDSDLRFEQAVPMIERLAARATRLGRGLGVKFTNTLVVRNTRDTLPGERAYLSGAPLHVLAMTLAHRFATATGGHVPMSFSAGLDADNVADTVACGFAPVTTCTDLLRPTGYRRLPRYLKALEREMELVGARDLTSFARRRAGLGDDADPLTAARVNLERYATAVAGDARYAAERHRAGPVREGVLARFDCASCNNCVLVCPNGAFFSLAVPPLDIDAPTLRPGARGSEYEAARFVLTRDAQWVLFADACNDCGNCDTFCPESGGPYRVKPRFFVTGTAFTAAAPADGILVERRGRRIRARFDGIEYRLERDEHDARFDDGVIEATLDAGHRVIATRVLTAQDGHGLPLARYHAMRSLVDAALADINPVSARLLAGSED